MVCAKVREQLFQNPLWVVADGTEVGKSVLSPSITAAGTTTSMATMTELGGRGLTRSGLPGAHLSHILLFVTATVRGRFYYNSPVKEKEIEAQRGLVTCPKVCDYYSSHFCHQSRHNQPQTTFTPRLTSATGTATRHHPQRHPQPQAQRSPSTPSPPSLPPQLSQWPPPLSPPMQQTSLLSSVFIEDSGPEPRHLSWCPRSVNSPVIMSPSGLLYMPGPMTFHGREFSRVLRASF